MKDTIGERIHTLRGNMGYGLRELSRLSGVSVTMLHRIEAEKCSPTHDVLCRLAQSLCVPLHLLVRNTKPLSALDGAS